MHSTTAASSLNLQPASIRPPPTTSLHHATLSTLSPYQTHTLEPTAFSTPTVPSYRPRATTPLGPDVLGGYASGAEKAVADGRGAGERVLLDELLAGNRAREAADTRLKLDVADRVSRWSHDVAVQGERAVQQMDAMHNQRTQHNSQHSAKPAEESKEELTPGYTLQPNATKAAWQHKPTATPRTSRDVKKQSKKDKEAEEAAARMRNMSLAYSPLSQPPSTSHLDALLPPPSAYIGSALGVSLSAFRGSEPLAISDAAVGMVSSSSELSSGELVGGGGSSSSAAATDGGSSDTRVAKIGATTASPFPTASALHAEVARVKACVTAAGMYVHTGAVEHALGGGRAVAGATPIGAAGAWPVPFSGLVDDPKEKKKQRAGGDKKTAAKKAVKKK